LYSKVLDTPLLDPYSQDMPQPFRLIVKQSPPAVALSDRAEADLAFVRSIVERSAQFTAVPGIGGILMGVTAVIAAIVAHLQPTHEKWLVVWIGDAIAACAIGGFTLVRKARRRSVPLDAAPARRFALGLAPAILAGAALTVGCIQIGAWSLLPALWMLCYGVAVLGAGAVSAAPVVPIMGGVFVLVGIIAVATPASWGDFWMGATFGLVHMICGAIVARHHGG
jgi:hypothetical protein